MTDYRTPKEREKTKECNECGETKPLTEFYRHPKTADGFLGQCKDCKRARSRRNWPKYAEKERKRQAKRNS